MNKQYSAHRGIPTTRWSERFTTSCSTCTCSPRNPRLRPCTFARIMPPILLLSICLGVGACTSGRHVSAQITSTSITDTQGRVQNATPGAVPLFARIVFTSFISYVQVGAIIGRDPYPWTCDEPPSPVPPPLAEQQHAFISTHAAHLLSRLECPHTHRLVTWCRSGRGHCTLSLPLIHFSRPSLNLPGSTIKRSSTPDGEEDHSNTHM